MHYIIDGYNLFFQITDSDPSPEAREEFVFYIAKLMKRGNLEGEMIFDTPLHHETMYAHSLENPPLIITLAPTNLEADDLIVEKLYALDDLRHTMVVTSDRKLAYRVKEVDGNVITVNAFMSLLRKKSFKDDTPEKPSVSGDREVKRYEEIFKSRLEDEND